MDNLKIDRNGIKVYVYEHPDFGIATFKAITHIEASLDSILAVMSDIQSLQEWVYSCNDSMTIQNKSFNERYHYQTINVPFPFKDRDFIFRSQIKQNPVTKSITITVSSDSNYCKKNNSNICDKMQFNEFVRVRDSFITFNLEPINSGTKVTWIQYTDPDGNLPPWLVNQFIENTPYQSLKKLAEKVKDEKYQYARLIYDLNGSVVALKYDSKKLNKKE